MAQYSEFFIDLLLEYRNDGVPKKGQVYDCNKKLYLRHGIKVPLTLDFLRARINFIYHLHKNVAPDWMKDAQHIEIFTEMAESYNVREVQEVMHMFSTEPPACERNSETTPMMNQMRLPYGASPISTLANGMPDSLRRTRDSKIKKEDHVKKPLNAFMWFIEENRPKILNEVGFKEKQSSELNKELGKRWQELSKEEQTKYFDMARRDREEHTRDRAEETTETKKCRARFGTQRQDQWCKSCKREKKCEWATAIEGMPEMQDRSSSGTSPIDSSASMEGPLPLGSSHHDFDTDETDLDADDKNAQPMPTFPQQFQLLSKAVHDVWARKDHGFEPLNFALETIEKTKMELYSFNEEILKGLQKVEADHHQKVAELELEVSVEQQKCCQLVSALEERMTGAAVLEDIRTGMEEEMKSQQSKIRDIEAELIKATATTERLEEQVKILEEERSEREGKMVEMEKEIAQLRKTKGFLEADYKSKDQEWLYALSRMWKLMSDNEALEKDLKLWRKDAERWEHAYNDLNLQQQSGQKGPGNESVPEKSGKDVLWDEVEKIRQKMAEMETSIMQMRKVPSKRPRLPKKKISSKAPPSANPSASWRCSTPKKGREAHVPSCAHGMQSVAAGELLQPIKASDLADFYARGIEYDSDFDFDIFH